MVSPHPRLTERGVQLIHRKVESLEEVSGSNVKGWGTGRQEGRCLLLLGWEISVLASLGVPLGMPQALRLASGPGGIGCILGYSEGGVSLDVGAKKGTMKLGRVAHTFEPST